MFEGRKQLEKGCRKECSGYICGDYIDAGNYYQGFALCPECSAKLQQLDEFERILDSFQSKKKQITDKILIQGELKEKLKKTLQEGDKE